MAIEFRCTKCNKLLRTADDTSGKHAKCPECGEILVIPSPGTPMPGPMPGTGFGSMPGSAAGPSPSSSPFAGGGGFAPPPSGPGGESPFAGGEQSPYQPETGNPYQSPSAYGGAPMYAAAEGDIRPTRIEFGDVFRTAWAVYSRQWLASLLGLLILGICYMVGAFGLMIGPTMIGSLARSLPVLVVCMVIGYLLVFLFISFLLGGGTRYFLNLSRGASLPLGDLFSGGPHLLSLFLMFLLFGLISLVLYAVCILPATAVSAASPALGPVVAVIGFIVHYALSIYIWTILSQTVFLIVDRRARLIESIQLSAQIMRGNKLIYFLIVLVVGIAIIVPILLAFSGMIFSTGLGRAPSVLPMVLIVLFMLVWYWLSISVFWTVVSVIYLKATGQPTLTTGPIWNGATGERGE